MRQQLIDGNLLPDVRVRPGRQVFSDSVVERQLALLRELRDGDGREHLVHRPQVELGIHAVRRPERSAGQSPGPLKEDAPLPRHHDRAGESIGRRELCHVSSDFLRQRLVIDGMDPARKDQETETEADRGGFAHGKV
jgi:hypothetical protein